MSSPKEENDSKTKENALNPLLEDDKPTQKAESVKNLAEMDKDKRIEEKSPHIESKAGEIELNAPAESSNPITNDHKNQESNLTAPSQDEEDNRNNAKIDKDVSEKSPAACECKDEKQNISDDVEEKERHISERPSNELTEMKEGNNLESATTSFNPVLSDDEEDLERLRGDAIGTTLYSERFVLSTLLKLTKVEKDLSEEFENELCSLWDMTIEEDVVKLLMEHGVFDLFSQCVDTTTDKRLTEILIGIIGNMCSIEEARASVCENKELVQTLLELLSCSDSLTLIQLTRLLSVVFIGANENEVKVWFKYFCTSPNIVQHITFILSNSANETLLSLSLEALNAMLAKFAFTCSQHLVDGQSFSDVFLKEDVIKGTVEAFRTLISALTVSEEIDHEIALSSHAARKTMQVFLNIHCILTQYNEKSRTCYAPCVVSMLECLSTILEPLCNAVSLLPLTIYEQEVLESINDIFLALGDPESETCLRQMITIWELIAEENKAFSRRLSQADEFEENDLEDNEINYEEVGLTVLDFIERVINRFSRTQLEKVLQHHKPKTVQNLLEAVSEAGSSKDASSESTSDKIKHVVSKISNSEST